jgi:hypothetical protein
VPWWPCPGLALDSAAEGLLLQVEEPRRALHVRRHLRRGGLGPLEDLPARQRVFELPNELLQVVLHDPVQVDQVAVDVVDHFDLGGVPQEVPGSAPGEHLHVARMRREAAEQQVSQAALASQPGNDG